MIEKIAFFILAGVYMLGAAEPGFQTCYDKAGSTADEISCIDKEYSYYDKILNQYYKEIMRHFRNDPGERKYLREAQRAWIVYRDKKCRFEGYPMRGGSAESVIVFGCRTTETKKRALELKAIAKDIKNNTN